MFRSFAAVGCITWLSLLVAASACARVELVEQRGEPQLIVDGQPFYIQGAGGDGDKALLKASGGNAFRTWGVGDDTPAKLDEAERLGLKVALGIWLQHDRHGFDYDDDAAVQQQFEDAKAAVLRFKDHPALLMWGVGNEMEEYGPTTNPKVWQAVNDIAEMIHEVDGQHPTMTVIAEIGGDRLESIETLCPAIDIVGINTYGGVTSIPQRYAALRDEGKITKPYVVAEFGPPGTWEIGRNAWDVPEELSSTQKAQIYTDAYAALKADPHCLGSFAFVWGSKQEATATWFGMFLPDGSRLAAIDAMTLAWSGQPSPNLVPRIDRLEILGSPQVQPGSTVSAELGVTDPQGDALEVEWVLFEEMEVFESAGDFRPTPPTFPEAITQASNEGVTLTMPQRPGNYRLFAYVRDGQGGAAVANAPLRVLSEDREALRGLPIQLPLVLYGDDTQGTPYTPSGYMGEAGAVAMDQNAGDRPRSGATCLEVRYDRNDAWAGVVWQHPANDWGDAEGGFDLTAADHLTFWARGQRGGEQVKFGFGLIGNDKPFYDTGKGEIAVTLTPDWQRYQIPLDGRDMACIKTGFYWTLAGSGAPVTFYLDDIAYTAEPQ